MSFLLVLSLLIIAQSTSSCSKAPARALNISGQFRTGFKLKGEQELKSGNAMPLHQRTQNFTDNLKTMYIRTPKVTSLCFHFSFLDQSKMQKHNLMLQSKSACIIQGASVGCHQTYFYMNLFILRSCSGGGSKCKQNVCTLSQTIYHMTTLCDHPKTKDK